MIVARANRTLLLLAPLALLAACGQKGPLFLPDEGVETPIEIRGPGAAPTTPAPAASPAAKPEDADDRNKAPATAVPPPPPAG